MVIFGWLSGSPEWYSWCLCVRLQSRVVFPFPDRTFIYRTLYLNFEALRTPLLLTWRVGFAPALRLRRLRKVPFGLSRLSYRRPRLWLFRGNGG
jgi:hypothetical protein